MLTDEVYKFSEDTPEQIMRLREKVTEMMYDHKKKIL